MSTDLSSAAEAAVIRAVVDGCTVETMLDRRALVPEAVMAVMRRHHLDVDQTGRLVPDPSHRHDWAIMLAAHCDSPAVRRQAGVAAEELRKLRRELASHAIGEAGKAARARQRNAVAQWRGVLAELYAEAGRELEQLNGRSVAEIVTADDADQARNRSTLETAARRARSGAA